MSGNQTDITLYCFLFLLLFIFTMFYLCCALPCLNTFIVLMISKNQRYAKGRHDTGDIGCRSASIVA